MGSKKVLYSIFGIASVLIVIILGAYVYQLRNNKTADEPETSTVEPDNSSSDQPVSSSSFQSEKGTAIILTSPERGTSITSPLSIAGSVPGTWSSEGQFTLRLLDANSNLLAEGVAKLDGDWMSVNQVPFSASLTFVTPASGSTGLLVLEKANPSDLEDNADALSVPIQF